MYNRIFNLGGLACPVACVASQQALLPCPFCGGKPATERFPVSHAELYYVVFCRMCCAESDWYESADLAAVAWNRRAPNIDATAN